MSEFGRVGQFGIEFEDPPLALLRLISLLSKNRRNQSRVYTKMECLFISDDRGYSALIQDLSHAGALLSSTFIPALQSKILIMLETGKLEVLLTLKGKVVRSLKSDYREMDQFMVEFEDPPQEFLDLILNGTNIRRPDQ
jgi:hypothetical protein